MKKRFLPYVSVACVLLLLQGCATINGNVPFKYTPSLGNGQPSDLRAGIKKFTDIRPSAEKKSTQSISDIDDKVTAKVIEDLRTSELFSKVSYPPQAGSDLVLTGEIKKFDWVYSSNPIGFIPFVNFLLFFGVPAGDMVGQAELAITVSDATGKILAVYDKSATKKSNFTIYQGKAGEMGAELADSFRDIMKDIKEEMSRDLQSGKLKKA